MEENYPEENKKWYKKWWGVTIIVFSCLILSMVLIIGVQVAYYYREIKSGRLALPGETKFQQSDTPASKPKEIDQTKLTPIGEPNSSLGAPITVVGFFDFECSYSKEANAVMQQMIAAYGNKVNFVFRNFPLTDIHPDAMLAAEAGECANSQNKFWLMSDRLFGGSSLSADAINLYAEQIGLDTTMFADCLNNYQSKGMVLKDILDGQTEGVGGTPTWFIDGEKVEGVIPADNFKKIIDYLLAEQKS
jgi:protein-disulfide isomerase